MPQRPLPWTAGLLALTLATLPALEVDADAPYLATEHQSNWIASDLAGIRFDFKRLHQLTVDIEPALIGATPPIQVTLVDTAPRPLKAVLADLEETLGQVVIAEQNRIRIVSHETALEERGVALKLANRALGLTPIVDFPGPQLIAGGSGDGGGGYDLFGGEAEDEPMVPSLAINAVDHDFAQAMGSYDETDTHLSFTTLPSRLERLRQRIIAETAVFRRQVQVRITVGLVATTAQHRVGPATGEQVAAIPLQPETRKTLLLRGRLGQLVNSSRLDQRSLVLDASPQSGKYDPELAVENTGQIAELRVLDHGPGYQVHYRFEWRDLVGLNTTGLLEPAGQTGSSLQIDTSFADDDDEETGDSSVDLSTGGTSAGARLDLDLPSWWYWPLRGTVYLPAEGAFVWSATHDDTTNAVLIMEVLP